MHPTDEQLDDTCAGALDAAARGEILEHVNGCARCGTRLRALQEERPEIARRLRLLDDPAPSIDPRSLMQRRSARTSPWRGALAASIALMLAAGSALALPGAPLHEWVVGHLGAEPSHRAPAIVHGKKPTAPAAPAQGVSVPVAGPMRVVFAVPQARGTLRIRVESAPALSIRGMGGASYSLEPDGIQIDNAGSTGDYELVIPRESREIEVRIGSRIVFTVAAGTVVTRAERDADGRYTIPLAPRAGS